MLAARTTLPSLPSVYSIPTIFFSFFVCVRLVLFVHPQSLHLPLTKHVLVAYIADVHVEKIVSTLSGVVRGVLNLN